MGGWEKQVSPKGGAGTKLGSDETVMEWEVGVRCGPQRRCEGTKGRWGGEDVSNGRLELRWVSGMKNRVES